MTRRAGTVVLLAVLAGVALWLGAAAAAVAVYHHFTH